MHRRPGGFSSRLLSRSARLRLGGRDRGARPSRVARGSLQEPQFWDCSEGEVNSWRLASQAPLTLSATRPLGPNAASRRGPIDRGWTRHGNQLGSDAPVLQGTPRFERKGPHRGTPATLITPGRIHHLESQRPTWPALAARQSPGNERLRSPSYGGSKIEPWDALPPRTESESSGVALARPPVCSGCPQHFAKLSRRHHDPLNGRALAKDHDTCRSQAR